MGRSDMTFSFLRHTAFDVWRTANDSGLYELGIEVDRHIVTDENAAGLQRSVPRQAELFAVDFRCRRESQARIAPWILSGWGRSFNGKYHLAGDAANGQVALDRQFSVAGAGDTRRLEEQRGELLCVKEVLAFQVCVALGIACVDGGHVYRSLDARVNVIGLIQSQHSSDGCELPLHIGDHHVLDLEFSHGMDRVDIPGSGVDLRRS